MTAGPRSNEPGDADRGRVLIVDDEEPLLEVFASALERVGFEVVCAARGASGLELAATHRPDVILLDRHLPDLSGQEVLDRLRATPETAAIPVLLISGDSATDRKVEGFGGGANDYLTKPVDLRELIARVEAQLTARDRWLSTLSSRMARRMSLAQMLAGISATQPLPQLLEALRTAFDPELALSGLALSLRTGPRTLVTVEPEGAASDGELTAEAGRALESPWLQRDPQRAIVHVPLQETGGTFAVLSVATNDEPASLLSTMVDLAPQVGALLRPAVDAASSTAADRDAVRHLLSSDAMQPVFQPIVDIEDGKIVGYEGLSRFADGTRPDLAFALAARVGLGAELELEAARRIVEAAHGLPEDRSLSLNISARTVVHPDLDAIVAAADRPVLLEITEHELVTDYGSVITAVEAVGAGLSVDDAGSGYASLRHVYELEPDEVKLDRGWVAGIDDDPVRQALITGLLGFTQAVGARIVAEGVERTEEHAALRGLGVHLGQGYHFGRPAPAAVWGPSDVTA